MTTETTNLGMHRAATARLLKALHAGDGKLQNAIAYAEGQRAAWRGTPQLFEALEKANVTAHVTAGDAGLTTARALGSVFVPLLRPRTLADRIPGWRRVPENVAAFRYSGDVTGAVITEGAPAPVQAFSFSRLLLGTTKKIGAIVVTTEEMIEASDPATEASLADQLAKAIGLATDRAMFQVDTAGSIANAGTVITSAGTSLSNIDSDLQRLIAYFLGADAGLDSAVFVLSSRTAAYLGSLRGTGGAAAFPTIGARGGSLLGIPAFVSDALIYTGSPSNAQITLFDPSQVLLADPGAADIRTSKEATLQMLDNPTNDVTTPTATNLVSLFQVNAVALAGRRWINWKVANSSAVVTLNGVTY